MFVWIADIDIAIALHNDSSNTSVLALGHHTEIIVFALRHIDGIWVHLPEHSIDASSDEFVIVEGINIVHI